MHQSSQTATEVMLSFRDISKVFRHQKCKVRAEAFPDRVYEGRVDRVMPIADRVFHVLLLLGLVRSKENPGEAEQST